MSVTIDGTNGVTASASFYGQSTFTGTYTDGIVVDYTTGTGRITVGAADGLKIRNGGTASPTDLMTLDASAALNVDGGTGKGRITLENGSAVNTIYATTTAFGAYNTLNLAASAYTFKLSNSTQAMTLDSSGNLLVGCTTQPSSTVSGFMYGPNGALYLGRSGTGTVAATYFINGNGVVGQINTSGSTTAYVTSSDYRLKENVQPMTGALSKVAALKPCTYTWKVDGSDGQGFIAHELAEVAPQAVVGEKDAVDTDGNPVYQGIDTSFLVATLTAAIQEQQSIIEQLRADVAALKG